MTADEWESIKSLFDAALRRPPEERQHWLEQACGGQPALLQTVQQLIHAYEETTWLDPRNQEHSPVFASGDLIAGRFRIRRLVAHGGMGQVYEAADTSLGGITIALKTMRAGLASEHQAIERFKREVWVAREIVHPGICRIFDLVEHKMVRPDGIEVTIPCLTMSLLEGRSLASHLSQNGPFSPEQALPIVTQLASCIQAMHANLIVHRDIKPSNIMLVPGENDEQKVILIDFGLAKPVNNQRDAWETQTQQQIGAPYFIAPEALSGEIVGPACDIYALGLVMDSMLTTRPAYHYTSMEELFWRKLHERPELPSARSTTLPVIWERVILQCLDRDPAKRPASALKVIEALNDTGPHGVSEAALLAVQTFIQRRVSASRLPIYSRRKWMLAVCVSAGAAALATYKSDHTGLAASILVMPFENLTAQQADYQPLCTGVGEALVRSLSYVKGLNVLEAPRNWTPDAASLKGIQYLLQGTLHDYEGTPKLVLKLTNNQDGRIIWSEPFKADLRKPLQLDLLVARKTIAELHRTTAASGWNLERLWPSDLNIKPGTTSNAASFDYQRGRALWQQRSLPAAFEAIKAYQSAIQADPRYALAYAALADVQHTLLTFSAGSTDHLMSQAVHYAETAISIDSSLPECHTARAAAKQNLWAWEDSESSYRQAIQKQPRFSRAHHWYAGLLLQFGNFEAALARSRAAIKLAPFDFPAQSNLGLYLWYAAQPGQAVQQLEALLQKTNLLFAHVVLGEVYAHMASQASEPDATRYFNKSMEHSGVVRAQELNGATGPDPQFLKWSDSMYARAYAGRNDMASAENYTGRLERGFASRKLPGTVLAWVYAAQQRWKQTLDMLEYGAENREREILYVKVHPLFRPLETQARYRSILKHMRLA